MKNLTSILSISLYLLLSIGVLKSTHYCLGQVKDVNYFSIKDDCAEEQEQPHACCDYLVEVIQLDEDQQQVKVKFNFSELNMIAPVFIPIEFTSLTTEIEASANYPLAESPPIYKRPLYQLNCSFTYYG
ncbi:MAG: hypothetical protein ABJH05_00655 [Fulvivirga sp.]